MCDVIASAPDDGFLSIMTVDRSARLVYNAHVHPAGPPPTIATSHSITSMCRTVVDVDVVGLDDDENDENDDEDENENDDGRARKADADEARQDAARRMTNIVDVDEDAVVMILL